MPDNGATEDVIEVTGTRVTARELADEIRRRSAEVGLLVAGDDDLIRRYSRLTADEARYLDNALVDTIAADPSESGLSGEALAKVIETREAWFSWARSHLRDLQVLELLRTQAPQPA